MALKKELTEGASARRKQAALQRAARERQERLAKAIATMDEIASMTPPKTPKSSKASRAGQGRAAVRSLGAEEHRQPGRGELAANHRNRVGTGPLRAARRVGRMCQRAVATTRPDAVQRTRHGQAEAVLLWHALAQNLMRMRAMNIAFAA